MTPTRYESVGCDGCRFIGTKECCLQLNRKLPLGCYENDDENEKHGVLNYEL